MWTAATLLCGWTYESLLTMLFLWEQQDGGKDVVYIYIYIYIYTSPSIHIIYMVTVVTFANSHVCFSLRYNNTHSNFYSLMF